jgi:cytochrome c oxidase assembly protein subunit 15
MERTSPAVADWLSKNRRLAAGREARRQLGLTGGRMTGFYRTLVKRLAVLATVGMFVVLVSGSTVTNTGSGEGCGTSWPLCNGEFIPEFAVATAIEYSHRAITSIEGLLILATSAGVWRFWRGRREVRALVPLMLFFLVLQAGLGQRAVKYPTSDEVLALHFGVSLIAFASVLLTTLFIHGLDNGADALRDRPAPPVVRWGAWGLAAYTYGVVYLGAYVNHTGSSLACLDWPLCNGSVFPGFAGPVGIAFSHRVAAAVMLLLVGWLFLWTWRRRAERPDLAWAAAAALALLLLQSLSGAAVVWTRLSLASALTHGALVTLLFGALSYCCLQVLPRPLAVSRQAPVDRSQPAVGSRQSAGDTELATDYWPTGD